MRKCDSYELNKIVHLTSHVSPISYLKAKSPYDK